MTQKELSEKIRVEERRKCRAEIEDLKARNRAPDRVMSMFHMYGLM